MPESPTGWSSTIAITNTVVWYCILLPPDLCIMRYALCTSYPCVPCWFWCKSYATRELCNITSCIMRKSTVWFWACPNHRLGDRPQSLSQIQWFDTAYCCHQTYALLCTSYPCVPCWFQCKSYATRELCNITSCIMRKSTVVCCRSHFCILFTSGTYASNNA